MSKKSNGQPKYPIGTIVYYGPDDKTVTKIAASVISSPEAEPVMRRWYGEDVATNREVITEMGLFFKQHEVETVAMTDHIFGCPHEEGVDYPTGESCPHCPFWKDRKEP